MHKSDTVETGSRARRADVECCDDTCESGLRNNYFEGKRLTPDMFRVEQRYALERRRLLNRAVHGWGVVYGYGITVESSPNGPRGSTSRRLRIEPGLALDPCGRELLLVRALTVALDAVTVIDEHGREIDGPQAFAESEPVRRKDRNTSAPFCWLLSAHYAERPLDHVHITDSCRCERDEWDHTCETLRLTLRRVPCDDCCRAAECELTCECGGGECCGDDGHSGDPSQQGEALRRPPRPFTRGGCRCVCDHLTRLVPGVDCDGCLQPLDEPCGPIEVDLAHGVPLACIDVVRDECQDWTFGAEVEGCGPRRLVKRNDLLFDLIRGCDLTRIIEIGWKEWHRQEALIPFDDFSHAMGPDGVNQSEYVTDRFWVRFSRPVRKETLLPDSFVMRVMSVDTEGGWWQTLRVPVARIDTTVVPSETGDPANHVRGARLVVDGSWVEDGFRGRHSVFYAGNTWVEIEIRGDFIVDCNGQAVDADPVGLAPAPTGNGAPGGTFLSSFRVAERASPGKKSPNESGDRGKGVLS